VEDVELSRFLMLVPAAQREEADQIVSDDTLLTRLKTRRLLSDIVGGTCRCGYRNNPTKLACHISTPKFLNRCCKDTESPDDDSEVVSCNCGVTTDDCQFMICCDICREWKHGRCEGIDAAAAPEEDWACHSCVARDGGFMADDDFGAGVEFDDDFARPGPEASSSADEESSAEEEEESDDDELSLNRGAKRRRDDTILSGARKRARPGGSTPSGFPFSPPAFLANEVRDVAEELPGLLAWLISFSVWAVIQFI
jgi:hypothetical protein